MTPQNEDPEAQAKGTDGGGAESPPADVLNTELPGAAAELSGATTEVSLPEGVTAEVPNDPTKPAAAAAMAKPPEFGDQKVPGPTRESEKERDAREMREKKAPPKQRNLLNEAIGDEFHITNDTRPNWRLPRAGQQFRVSRHYIHKKVAVDYLDNSRQMANDVSGKRAILNADGIVYIAIGPREAFTTEEVQDMIERERTTIADLQEGGPNAT